MKKTIEELQKEEAVKRLGMFDIMPQVLKDFEEGVLNCSEMGGVLFWLSDEMKEYVSKWEEETGNIAYHVIKNHLEFGVCHSILYVSKEKEEWDMDNADLKEGYPLVYVYNETCPECSEYGSIGIRSVHGGFVRTA